MSRWTEHRQLTPGMARSAIRVSRCIPPRDNVLRCCPDSTDPPQERRVQAGREFRPMLTSSGDRNLPSRAVMKPRRQSSTTWITLLACIFVALLPAGGLVICFGHGGDHFGIGALAPWSGADVGAHACPCEPPGFRGSMDGPAADTDDRHPPCRDTVVEAPLLYLEGHRATLALDASLDTDGGSPPLPPLNAILPPRRSASAEASRVRASWLGTLLSPALRDRRTIILLI